MLAIDETVDDFTAVGLFHPDLKFFKDKQKFRDAIEHTIEDTKGDVNFSLLCFVDNALHLCLVPSIVALNSWIINGSTCYRIG